ncbi:hypothetical protein Q9L42_007790 [Methylomarinum sp. Ch1-1]|uniref:Uncharacterized protein n=1 Tax=Methylomarinum roseum TaxID=3067653 RepID=A0AAU7NYF8_9GAMM
MNADNAGQMSMLELDLCQDNENSAVCVAEAPADNTLIDDEGCYSGNLCTPHFHAINTDAGIAKQFFNIPSFLVTPTRVAILSQIIPPEIKPPIGIA